MVRKRIFKATLLALFTLLLFNLSPGLVAADETIPTGTPHAFYGNLLINGNPAPAGTKVEAKGTGVKPTSLNPLLTSAGGRYGTAGPTGNDLLVQGSTLADGTIITFYVNDVSTGQTTAWHSGELTQLDLAVTITQQTTLVNESGGGGGGGGPSGITLRTDILGSTTNLMISDEGRVTRTTVITSPDGKLEITIPINTIALNRSGNPFTSLSVNVHTDPVWPVPEDEHVIGLWYDFQPDGATFNPPIQIVFTYDPNDLPQGVLEEELAVAFYDEDAGVWVPVPSVVNSGSNTITAQISHFTTFAIIGKEVPVPLPAAFSPSSLTVSPSKVNSGEAVAISIIVTNTGGQAGTHDVMLKVNGVMQDSRVVSLIAGESKQVSFTISKDTPGMHQIEVDGLKGAFEVKAVAAIIVPATTNVPNPQAMPEEGGIQWWVWVVAAAMVSIGAIGAGLYFYRRRE